MAFFDGLQGREGIEMGAASGGPSIIRLVVASSGDMRNKMRKGGELRHLSTVRVCSVQGSASTKDPMPPKVLGIMSRAPDNLLPDLTAVLQPSNDVYCNFDISPTTS